MLLKWMNAEKTILQVDLDDGKTLALEPSSPQWGQYSGLEGIYPYVPPTPEEVAEQERAQAESSRQAAFQLEADPLFFKWQAGEGTKEEWEAKRAEIRERYPYSE